MIRPTYSKLINLSCIYLWSANLVPIYVWSSAESYSELQKLSLQFSSNLIVRMKQQRTRFSLYIFQFISYFIFKYVLDFTYEESVFIVDTLSRHMWKKKFHKLSVFFFSFTWWHLRIQLKAEITLNVICAGNLSCFSNGNVRSIFAAPVLQYMYAPELETAIPF